jgi:competence protein ComEA
MIAVDRASESSRHTFVEVLITAVFVFLLFMIALFPCSGQSLQSLPPVVKQPTVGEKIAASKDLLDINTATAAELKALPGMGDAYVARLIAGRPYTAKNQLTQRGILPASAYERIKPLIVAHRLK